MIFSISGKGSCLCFGWVAIALLTGSCNGPQQGAASQVAASVLPGTSPSPTRLAQASATPETPSSEQDAATQQLNCSSPQTQAEMNQCSGSAAETADQQLNQVYRKLRNTLKSPKEDDLLVEAQLAWIKFRDTNCAFSSGRFEGGSMAPMVYSSCIERVTKQRTEELERYAAGIEKGSLF